jgi:FAD/FMN-containing dehydrogenase
MADSAVLKKVLGDENYLDDAPTLETYSRDESFCRPQPPRAVVRVSDVGQVQDVVKWANQTRTPLVPVSSGPPHHHGDTVPALPEAVIVDLTGMKKIIHLDLRNRMVIVEPGVTFGELQPFLAQSGLRLSSPLAPRANKSVLTSLLEREPIVIPRYQWAALDPLRCLEIVWGDGNRITTGEAGSLGSLQEEWDKKLAQVNPQGPAQTDFYKIASAAQGSMGIATWASLKCEINPTVHNLYFIPAEKLEDLLDFAYSVLRIRFGDELLILNRPSLASVLARRQEEIPTLVSTLPAWTLLLGIAGRDRLPEKRLAFQEKDLTAMAAGAGLPFLRTLPGIDSRAALAAVLGPVAGKDWRTGVRDACQEIFFLNTLEKAPEFIAAMNAMADSCAFPRSDIGIYLQPIHQGTSCHIEFDLPFNRSDPAETQKTKLLYLAASRQMALQGGYFSRPYGAWAELAFNRDAMSAAVVRKIKGIFDPNNVMNPGKLGF